MINFNNGKSKANEYTQRIYGRDLAKSQDMAPAKTEQAYLPVMGIVRNDNALLEVVTEGSRVCYCESSGFRTEVHKLQFRWFNSSSALLTPTSWAVRMLPR